MCLFCNDIFIDLYRTHVKKQDQELLPQGFDLEEMPILKNQYEACLKQIGTLGGGNHFIEIQKDTETSDVWVMIHSGSRNIGLKVANHYNKIAQYLYKLPALHPIHPANEVRE